MKPARNEIEAWQEMAYALPPTYEEKPEYGRGPSPIPAAVAVVSALLLWAAAIYVFA